MSTASQNAISPTRAEDYPEWYQQVVRAADLAEPSPVRGCMVIKPWGYSLWENIQRSLDDKFKATGHQNAYFPLLIPVSYLAKEAEHIKGFAKECAVVTHHRLEADGQGGLVPAGRLEEPLVVRPTSETIIGVMFAKWVQSYRDLPLLINQWANVVRWEMRTRLFLRTTEFLWQEGHTAHATSEEAQRETAAILDLYADFAENEMAMPVIKGEKTESERFPGAVSTVAIEAMMQDRKALQSGTSHFLGQNFARASEIKFLDARGQEAFAWTTSWGVSTRLIGGLVMTHGDDDGLILPPRLAPAHVAILPVIHKEETRAQVLDYCEKLAAELRRLDYQGRPLRVELDTRELRGGEKVWSWIKKGVPIRLEIGPRDIARDAVFVGRRDRPHRQCESIPRGQFVQTLARQLDEIQRILFERARAFREEHTVRIDTQEAFYEFFTPANREKPEIHGGFALCHWSGEPEVEEQVKRDLQVTIRSIPLDAPAEAGACPFTGKPSSRRVVFAKAY
ncbi:MAG: proline--tRNA ligase [Planctomycetes bacterium RBG_16_64_12]|nr:MAG: proline--tRNA ligase [Planctomycetes bacterium RBG_16_64_12]